MPHVPVWGDEHVYIVEGTGYFPFDMLRRDRSFPADELSAIRLGQYQMKEPRRVTLIAARARDIVVKRWESFGWEVVAGFAAEYPMRPVCGEPFELAKHGDWQDRTGMTVRP